MLLLVSLSSFWDTNSSFLASSGEYSDFQEAQHLFEHMQQTVKNADDNISYSPHDFANFLGINLLFSPGIPSLPFPL